MRSHLALLLISAATLTAQTPLSFEVATVRPTAGPIEGVPAFLGQQRSTADTLTIRNTALFEIIRRGFDVVAQELVGPDWIREERFDIVGKSLEPTTDAELWRMIQPLLEERFKLKYHREPRQVSGLALVPARNGPKIKQSDGGSGEFSMANGIFRGTNVPISRLAQLTSSVMQQPVMDATGLEGRYDFMFEPRKYATPGTAFPLQELLRTAIQEELGLHLESRKFEIQIIVIDHIERPGEN